MRQLTYPAILVLIMSMVIGCSKDESSAKSDKAPSIPSQASLEFTHDEQTFQIIPLYEEILEYTGLVQDDPSQHTKVEYGGKVVVPFQQYAAEKNIDIGNMYFPFFQPTENPQTLEENTVQLLEQQDRINTLIKESLIKSANYLSGGTKTVFVMPLNPENTFTIQKMDGVWGLTMSEGAILLQIDPSFKEETLNYIVAHEYHHAVNMERSGKELYSLMEAVIFEGKADSFAGLVYPDYQAPWAESLANKSQHIVLEELRKNANSYDSSVYNEFFTGNSAKDIPLWSNYKIGFQITQSYLDANPGVSIGEWTEMEANEVVQGGEYKYLLE
ncbi:DUF2268 domain-containing putative Zn-dependent protease [Rossellomorea sp. AcN35-11]|nr:DUF2268 domain-containing protein [Rossellomorea aquimaris]WJV29555.1 DUF2268 domain-containing putative Zn-dependent protease [Rossellomorea sp. AcN35-11]